MFMFPSDIDELVEWIALIASAAPNLPCLYYHIPVLTKVTRKFIIISRSILAKNTEYFSLFSFNGRIIEKGAPENSQFCRIEIHFQRLR